LAEKLRSVAVWVLWGSPFRGLEPWDMDLATIAEVRWKALRYKVIVLYATS